VRNYRVATWRAGWQSGECGRNAWRRSEPGDERNVRPWPRWSVLVVRVRFNVEPGPGLDVNGSVVSFPTDREPHRVCWPGAVVDG